MFALGGEEVGPGDHLGVLLEQCPALALGHATPDTELDAIVEGVGAAFEDHRAVPADDCGLALGGSTHEKLIGVCLPAARLRNPRNPGLGLSSGGGCVELGANANLVRGR